MVVPTTLFLNPTYIWITGISLSVAVRVLLVQVGEEGAVVAGVTALVVTVSLSVGLEKGRMGLHRPLENYLPYKTYQDRITYNTYVHLIWIGD